MTTRIETSRDIAAPAQAVYDAIADVTRMGEWSEECHTCAWHEGYSGPEVDAVFDGHNRIGDKEWTTQGRVIEAEPGRAFAFECSMYDIAYARWGYRIESIEGASRVTEWTEDFRSAEGIEFATRVSGIADRESRNRETMSGTLERLAAALES